MKRSAKLTALTQTFIEEMAPVGLDFSFDMTYQMLRAEADEVGRRARISAAQVIDRYMTEESMRKKAAHQIVALIEAVDGNDPAMDPDAAVLIRNSPAYAAHHATS